MWRPDVFWLHVISDATIAIAYLSIPAAIAVLAIQRRETGRRWVLWMFSAFVLACGMTHIFSIWTMWYPDYGASGIMKATTALVSIVTAAALWPLLPKAIRIPTVAELEGRVQDRTRDWSQRTPRSRMRTGTAPRLRASLSAPRTTPRRRAGQNPPSSRS